MILHDWSDDYCLKILRHLRDAAGPRSQLVVIDNVVTYSCGEPEGANNIPGAEFPHAPPPVLPNQGEAVVSAHISDLQVSANLPVFPSRI